MGKLISNTRLETEILESKRFLRSVENRQLESFPSLLKFTTHGVLSILKVGLKA